MRPLNLNTKVVSITAAVAFACSGTAQAALEEIVVTAQKRTESVQDVPISISAYSSDFLDKSGVSNLKDISLYAPNLTLSSAGQKANTRISIRGVGSVGNAGIEPAVGVYIDGVYYPKPGSVIGELIDLQTIEVLRGPQGTLFGRNTPAGALNITTKAPSRDAFESDFAAGFGSQSSFNIGGSVSGPLSDSAAYRLSAKYSERDGWGNNLLTGEEQGGEENFNIRGKVQFDVSPNFQLSLAADYGEIDGVFNTIEVDGDTTSRRFLGTLAQLFGPQAANFATEDQTDHDVFHNDSSDQDDQQGGVMMVAEYDLDSGLTLKSITSYREWEATFKDDPVNIPASLLNRTQAFSSDTFSQEFQLISPQDGNFDYVAGLYFYDEQYTIDTSFDVGSDFCSPVVAALGGQRAAVGCARAAQTDASVTDFDQDLTSYAAYGQGTYRFNDKFSITLGGRYTNDDKTADFVEVVNNPLFVALGLTEPDVQANLDIDEFGDTDSFTYFANAKYFATDDVMLYFTASSGFKSGGFNTAATNPALVRSQRGFGPEESTNYEVGIKSELLDNTLQINATLFRMEFEDYQDRAFDGLAFVTRNIGELRQQGLEADITWAPLDQLTVNAGISLLDSEFLDFRNASALPGGQPQDLTGQSAHYSPDEQISLVVDWRDEFKAIQGTEYFIRLENQFIGEQNIGGNTNQNPQTIEDSYSLFNARVGLGSSDGGWEVALWGRNLSDEGYCINRFDQPLGGPLGAVNRMNNTTAIRCAVGNPRTYGIEFKYRGL